MDIEKVMQSAEWWIDI
ncbi:hypothetical protein CLS_19630 [[Clostridium] cf. saccharolyticum K10]|nr:hypothetical protein CLS_19630 [[Clostridium] cf. saccharolyticum K10]